MRNFIISPLENQLKNLLIQDNRFFLVSLQRQSTYYRCGDGRSACYHYCTEIWKIEVTLIRLQERPAYRVYGSVSNDRVYIPTGVG